MDCNFNDNEFVIRAVLPPEMRPKFWKNGKLTPSALKDKRGLSVDRTYDKSIDFIINHMRKNKGLIGLMVSFTMTDCKDAEATFDNPLFRGIKAFRDWQKENEAESDFGYSKTAPTNAQIKNKLKALFDEIINEHGERLILFVDELDRCKPDFAVRVLERLKHYFTIDDRVKIVFSVNINQLEHTIKHFYGDDFDSHRYLDRFFDMVLPIPEAETTLYIARYMKRNVMSDDFSSGVGVCSIIEYFGIQIRDIKRFMSELDSGYDTVNKDILMNAQLNKYQNFMNYIYPIILAAKFKDKEKYKLLIQGKGEDIINNFYKYDQKTPDAINVIIDIYIRFFDAKLNNQYSTKIIKYIEKPFGI